MTTPPNPAPSAKRVEDEFAAPGLKWMVLATVTAAVAAGWGTYANGQTVPQSVGFAALGAMGVLLATSSAAVYSRRFSDWSGVPSAAARDSREERHMTIAWIFVPLFTLLVIGIISTIPAYQEWVSPVVSCGLAGMFALRWWLYRRDARG